MKPFLLLQSRPEDAASDNEYEAFWQMSGLTPDDVVRLRMDKDDLPDVIDFSRYSGIFMGGGPANLADPAHKKSLLQQRFEPWLLKQLSLIVKDDVPFLGTCLGFGALTVVLQGQVDFEYGEPVSAVAIEVLPDGIGDPLLREVAPVFDAFVGHKEGVGAAPVGAVELARSAACSQMIRVGNNVYATQFHPELDGKSLALRIQTYRNAGYFHPSEAESLIEMALEAQVSYPVTILKSFALRYHK